MNSNLETYIFIIEEALKKYNPEHNNLQKSIYSAMNYSLEAGGKRLRPILLLEFYKILGGNIEDVLPFACALEMIHTYSLIHDDLPAMDNDNLRRGKPTNHIVYGEATAILAGDALLTKAFELMSNSPLSNKNNVIKAISYIAACAGCNGMIGGQIVDMENENKLTDIETLRYMHSLKTGALIRSACVVGGILAGTDEKTIETITEFAESLGIAFQIRDDILDVSGDEITLGKPIGSDSKSNKSTYVSLLGLTRAEELCNEYTEKALSCLNKLPGDTSFLEALVNRLATRVS